MTANNEQYSQRYFLSMIVAMSLNILPLSNIVKGLNPEWVLLFLIYWSMAVPERTGVFNAWLLGVLVDVLTGRLLGMHGLIYALINYTCLIFHRRLRHYPIPQQTIFVFFCLLISQVLVFWIESLQGNTGLNWMFWLPVLTGTVCWPFIFSGLRWFRLLGRFA